MNGLKDYIKTHTPRGLRRSVYQALRELRFHLRHRSAVGRARRFVRSLPLKLNLGCGPNRKPGWVNIDLFHSAADLQLDLRERWRSLMGALPTFTASMYSNTSNSSKKFLTSCQSLCVFFRPKGCSMSGCRTQSGLFADTVTLPMITGLLRQHVIQQSVKLS
jgi:hypothetical protein